MIAFAHFRGGGAAGIGFVLLILLFAFFALLTVLTKGEK
jgi:hypothetical protein